MKTNTKKLLSILLALMMMLSVVPMYASAADPIALTRSNVKIIPPVAEPSVASYGITYSDIALTGGTLWYVSEDGTETLVPGKFIWTSSGTSPINVGTVNPGLKFQPDDQNAFSTSGRLSSTSTTIVSGEWPTITILGTPTPRISKVPTVSIVEGITKTYGEATIEGGTAVDKDTNANIPGTFIIADEYKEMAVESGAATIIRVRFIPDDLEAYTDIATAEVLVLIKKSIKFVDSNGTETVPEITVPYGTKLKDGDMAYYISQAGCTVVAGKDGCYYGATDADGYIFGTSGSGEAPEVGTHYYEFIARPYTTVGVTSYYEETVLKLKVNVTPLEAEMKLDTTPIKGTDGLELWVWHKDTSIAANPQGTFTVYLDGAVYKENVKYGEHFTWQPAESKAYEFKATYTPVENDPFSIADFILTRDIKLTRKLTASENILSGYGDFKYGTTVEISANLTSENFAGWKITDAQGNEVTLDGIDNSSRKITITMPDYDIHVEALEKGATGGDDSTGGIFDGLGDLTQGDSDNPIVNFFNNIIAWFRNLIETIKNFFRGIGDVS